jgi:hypothetical protein
MKHPPQRMVLVAPFTSLLDMARRSVGGPLSHSRSDRYDNRASLRAVRAHGLPPLAILRGQNDRLIPNSMGAELAALAPAAASSWCPALTTETSSRSLSSNYAAAERMMPPCVASAARRVADRCILRRQWQGERVNHPACSKKSHTTRQSPPTRLGAAVAKRGA